jgi:hypothetical protein
MTAITTEYQFYMITYEESRNQWVCHELGFHHFRLSSVKQMIDQHKQQQLHTPLKVRYLSDVIKDADGMFAFVTAITPDAPSKHRVLAFIDSIAGQRMHAFDDFAFDTPENSALIDEWLFLRAQADEAIFRTRKAKQAIPRCTSMELLGLGVPVVKLVE